MSWFTTLTRRRSASVARERLQILLTHERGAASHPNLLPILREEILAVVAKHVVVEPDKVQVRIDCGKSVSLLEIDIEVPSISVRDSGKLPLTPRRPNILNRSKLTQRAMQGAERQ